MRMYALLVFVCEEEQMAAKTDRQPVQVDAATIARLREYSEATGVPIARAVTRAVNEWLDAHGKQHMQALTIKPKR